MRQITWCGGLIFEKDNNVVGASNVRTSDVQNWKWVWQKSFRTITVTCSLFSVLTGGGFDKGWSYSITNIRNSYNYGGTHYVGGKKSYYIHWVKSTTTKCGDKK